jgi:hypothetical protein
MRKILILGGNSNNLGGETSKVIDGCALYSRSTQPALDLLDFHQVNRVFEYEKPEVAIYMAAIFPDLTGKKLGAIDNWHEIDDLLDIKIKGGYIALNAAVRWGVKTFIFMAGSALSSDSRFCHFTVVNGALWSLVQFATLHALIDAYYLEMGMVLPSNMGKLHLSQTAQEEALEAQRASISPRDVSSSIDKIILGQYPRGSRVVINKGDI